MNRAHYPVPDQAGWRPRHRSRVGGSVVGDPGHAAAHTCGTSHDPHGNPAYGPDLAEAGDGSHRAGVSRLRRDHRDFSGLWRTLTWRVPDLLK